MTRRLTHVFIISALLTALVACTMGNKNNAPVTNITAPLDSLFTALFPNDDEPGAIVLMAQGDSIIYNHGFGASELSDMTPMSDSTLLNICSISKQFSAMALLKLQEDSLLSLDDPLLKYFPKLPAKTFEGITLRHLLSHTSGIPDARPRNRRQWNEYTSKHSSLFGSGRDYMLFALWEESTRYLESLDWLEFQPGKAYKYQNPTYQLVLPIVEQVTGAEFCAWMDSCIFKPAGMATTQYLDPNIKQPEFGHAYRLTDGPNRYNYFRSSDDKWEEFDYGEANFFPTKADGALYTSAREFLKWEKALFSGRIINEKSLKEATTPVIATGEPYTYYGLGLFIEERPDRPRKIYHTGDNGGFLCVEAYYPDKDLFYLIFANRPDWNREKTIQQTDSILAAKGRI